MKNLFKPYPTLNKETIKLNWLFMGRNSEELQNENGILRYAKSRNEFDYKSDKLKISCKLNFDNDNLNKFIKTLNNRDSINVKSVIRCFSQTSRQRFLGNPVDICLNNSGSFVISAIIHENTVRGIINFELIIINNSFINNFRLPIGDIIYQSESEEVRVDGKGSIFPVYFVSEVYKPLWWVDFNIDDPETDTVISDSISLNINKSHPDFKLICSKDSEEINNTIVLKHIYAGVFFQLLMLLRGNEDWWKVVVDHPNNTGEINTIASLANYGYLFLWGNVDPIKKPNELFEKLLSILDKKLDTKVEVNNELA